MSELIQIYSSASVNFIPLYREIKSNASQLESDIIELSHTVDEATPEQAQILASQRNSEAINLDNI